MMTLEKPSSTLAPTAKVSPEVFLGSVDQIPKGEGRVFPVGGTDIAVFRTRHGAVYAVQAECPHKQGPLADGLLGGTTIMCPFHSRKFDLTTGIGQLGDCHLRTYPVRLDDSSGLWLTV